MRLTSIVVILSLILVSNVSLAQKKVVYNLIIDEKTINYSGEDRVAMAVNDSIPGPTLKFKEGDLAEIHVTNKMAVETSVHWHGLILPNYQDGVPYLTTPPILPGETLVYEFPISHSGTYWYHSHTGLQEQRGVYGSIVIEPKKKTLDYDHNLVLVLSDWTDEDPDEVLRTLKRGSEWYSIRRKTAVSISEAISNNALSGLFKLWSMRMPGIDISDVAYDAFLTNGKKEQNYPNFKAGEKVRVRIVNAAASTYFWLTFGGKKPMLVAADGVDVVPVKTNKVLHAIAETYDFIVTVPKGKALEFRAWAQDGSGSTGAIIGKGDIQKAMMVDPPNYIKRTKMAGSMGSMDSMKMDHKGMKHSAHMKMNMSGHSDKTSMKENKFSYDILKSPSKTKLDHRKPVREVELNLTGNMWRYIWSMNGKTLSEVDKIKIKKGEVVRVTLNNKTMMHHPMHLHGHFFRVLNENGEYSPLKHTVDVEPMKSITIEFDAVETGDWFFHCHVLYHMKGGMARVFSYGTPRDPRLKKFALANVLNTDKAWFTWARLTGASHLGSVELTSSNTRNQVNLGVEYGWNKNLEADFSYERYLGDYFRFYGGVNTENKTEDSLDEMDTIGTLGVRWLLPYFINTDLRIDSDLNLQFSLGTEVLLLPRTFLFGYWEVSNDFGWKTNLAPGVSSEQEYVWNVGLEYVLTKNLSLMASYENRFGAGAGLSYLW